MFNQINGQKDQLFQQLSEQEQEIASGGCSQYSPSGMFVYQEKNVLSYANNNTKISDGVSELYNEQTSFYSLTEKILFWLPFNGGSRRNRNGFNNNMNWLISLFS
ncbi:hypothetical protein H6G54_14740 [Anabaena cylindrica FACHB-243]|uniref:Uncharacterized protein n=1 Tax=Anabaena cylindrica (strain ATCC 27899 / PCC 7122) TaxID=272123 RepID=K9ZNH2_ANACC|nr:MULTISPECIES: hypothetical protein [Anabaena]AFZ60339.1 hypothetical protein Anacy_4999 [Anabaena cylindrica PCC 7122]MBD2418935.1 hypothetical protein [Anabaena cylindrica FACHB-243]MBY5285054.1 hypothetical protein [Anabaena sp. CCAP 1446/1C]MBY5310900.1 hypothetical protein [Anabaena sp. CCAP 1446/1C]MCM2404526.1 hypothetical protein [Anabaena sp. CCAP 1446/1C]